VVYGNGEEGFMEPSFRIEVLPPLEVRVPRDQVDLEARSLVVYMDRPAGGFDGEFHRFQSANSGPGQLQRRHAAAESAADDDGIPFFLHHRLRVKHKLR
jgi:hypothetical protein